MVHRVHKENVDLNKMYERWGQEDYKKRYRYQLYAIIAHIGEITNGHYLTYVRYKYQESTHWLLFDGAKYCQVLEETVLKSDGKY